jgi:DNA-binding transcriptional regulator YiaG
MTSRSPSTIDEIAYAATLGRQIAATRKAARLSQTEFAERLGVVRNTVWRWETGRALPNAYQLNLIKRTEKAPPRRPAKESR